MTQPQEVVVIDRDGERGLIQAYDPREKRYVIAYDGQTLLLPADLLVALGEHYYTVPLSLAEALGEGELDVEQNLVIPVLQEELHLAKRVVEKSKIRVHKAVIETEEIVDEPLIEDLVEIERVPINRLLKKAIGTRIEGDTTIIPVLKEVLVVQKQLMLVEEVRLRRKQVEVRRPQPVILRREEVRIERVPPGAMRDEAVTPEISTAAVYAKGD